MVTPLLLYLSRPVRDEQSDLKYLDFYSRYEVRSIQLHVREPCNTIAVIYLPLQRANTIVRRYMVIRRGNIRICRLHFVPLYTGELFYLRALLLYRIAYTFASLRTIDGRCYNSFQSVAITLGLFRDQNEVEYVIEEAIEALFRPTQLRFLFANLLCNIAIGLLRLQEKFARSLLEDFTLYVTRAVAEDRALYALANILRGRGFTLEQAGLLSPAIIPSEVQSELDQFASRLPEIREACRIRQLILNLEQASIYEALVQISESEGPYPPVFINGKAGRRKSFLVEYLTQKLRGKGEIVLVIGTTALSVIGYDRGRTVYSTFGIPVTEDNTEFSYRIRPGLGQAKLIYAAKLIIQDELPIANRAVVEAVDILLRQLKESSDPFGRVFFLALGDFRQVILIVRGYKRVRILDASIRASHLQIGFQIFRLYSPIRNGRDKDFADQVDRIGEDLDTSGVVDVIR